MTVGRRGLLIFDVDGTLYRTETSAVPAWVSVFEEFGSPAPSFDEITSFLGRPDIELQAWLRARLGDAVASDVYRAFARRELEMVTDRGELYPGVREALAGLRAQAAAMAVCSNGPEYYVTAVLEAMQLRGVFDAVRWREPEDSGKPQMMASLLGRFSEQPVVVVGDRRDDVEGARENGAFAVGAAYGYGRPGELDGADAIVHSAGQLPEAIARLIARSRGA